MSETMIKCLQQAINELEAAVPYIEDAEIGASIRARNLIRNIETISTNMASDIDATMASMKDAIQADPLKALHVIGELDMRFDMLDTDGYAHYVGDERNLEVVVSVSDDDLYAVMSLSDLISEAKLSSIEYHGQLFYSE